MKKSTLRNIIKEEIKKSLNEDYSFYKKDPRFKPLELDKNKRAGDIAMDYVKTAMRGYQVEQKMQNLDPDMIYRTKFELKDNQIVVHFFEKPTFRPIVRPNSQQN